MAGYAGRGWSSERKAYPQERSGGGCAGRELPEDLVHERAWLAPGGPIVHDRLCATDSCVTRRIASACQDRDYALMQAHH